MKTGREQWQRLSLREKQAALIGGIAIGIFLLYEIIWAPLANSVDQLHNRVAQNRELLSWMQETDTQMHALSQTTTKKSMQENASLLSTMQSDIKKTTFASHVSQLRQAENNTVQMNLQKVSFDEFIRWLIGLGSESGLVVTQVSVLPTGVLGEVNVNLVVEKIS